MAERNIKIQGRLTDTVKRPLNKLRIEAWDKDLLIDDFVGEALSDEQGAFTISFTQSRYKELFLDRDPDIYFKVYNADVLIYSTENFVLWNIKSDQTNLEIIIDTKVDDIKPNKPWKKVFGYVRNEFGELLRNVTIQVFDRDLRSEQLLGEIVTKNGEYEIVYRKEKFLNVEKKSADIVVKVLDSAGNELFKTSVFYNAPDKLEVNINLKNVVYKGASEWQILSNELIPLMVGVSPLELREDGQFQDVSFLSGESGQSEPIIVTWIACHHLSHKTVLEETPLAAEIFFGFLRQGQPALSYNTLMQDLRQPDRMELLNDKILRDLSNITPELQQQVLEKALTDNLIPQGIRVNIKGILETLRRIKLRYVAESTFGGGKGTIGQLLQLTPEAYKDQIKFLAAFADYSGPISDFWTKLEADGIFKPEVIRDVKLNFELGALTLNYLPLVAVLNQQFKAGKINAKRDLAKLDRKDWINILKSKGSDGKPVGVPPNIEGESEEKKFEQYSFLLEQGLERSYPTTSFMAKLDKNEQSSLTVKNDVVRFLDSNPTFHLDTYRIDHYIAENPDSLNPVKDKDAMIQQLKTIQRVFKLNPTHQAVDALLSRKIESAQQIYFIGKEQFITTLADTGINALESKKLYQKAENAYAMALSMFANYNYGIIGIIPFVTPSPTPDPSVQPKIAALPNLQTLFGSLDYCECTNCRSVYSPAAHFVDILRFLGERNTNGTPNIKVKQALLTRRPDLGEIELSCENTNTPLPYIDLVNEILEDVVAPPVPIGLNSTIEPDLIQGTIKTTVRNEFIAKKLPIAADAAVYAKDSRNQWAIRDKENAYKLFKSGATLNILSTKQTHLSAAELRSNPEYTNPLAYNKLALQVFPFNLPFNLWYLQSRTYMNHLGVAQPRLFELFQQASADIAGNVTLTPGNLQIDCAWLGIAETERKIITETSPFTGTLAGKQPWDFWGLHQGSNNISHPETPTDIITNVTGTWIEVLSHVSVMLHRTGLSYKELLQVLDMKYINPVGSIFINDNADRNAANCDTTKFRIVGLTEDALGRMHRFIRLWRRVGCNMWELDMLLPDINPDVNVVNKQITNPVLQDISRMSRIRVKYDWDWRVTMALYNDIDHTIYLDRSKSDAPEIQTLYQSLFRNKLVDVTAVFPESPDQISGPIAGNLSLATPIPDKVPGILAAFRINEEDLNLILAHLSLTTVSQLSWTILSRIYRTTLLTKAAGLNIDQFIRLKRLSAIDPFANPGNTLTFIGLAEKIGPSSFSIEELDYLLNHRYKSNAGLALEDKFIQSIVNAIREGLQKIVDDMSLKSEERPEAYIKSKLGLLPALTKDKDQSKALAIINGTWQGTLIERNRLIDQYFIGVLPDLTVAKANFAPPPPSGAGLASEARFQYLQPELQAFLLKTQKELVVKQKIAEVFQLQVPAADLLVAQLQIVGSTGKLLQHLNDTNLLQKQPDGTYRDAVNEARFPNIFKSLRLLHKNAMVIGKLKMKVEELNWWMAGTHAVDLVWPHPQDFPIDITTSTSVSITKWSNIADFFAWKDKLPQSELTVFEFLDSVLNTRITATPNIAALGKLADWDTSDITILTTAFNWNVKLEFRKSAALIRLSDCMKALQRLGVNATRAIAWAKAEPAFEDAESMKQTVKAKYDLTQWQQVIQPIQDAFREQKRDALASWLITQNNPNWLNANGLYSYFLIDVEMSACMLTSRLKQATASAQLFVQRCLMNLETDISVRAEKTDASDTKADSKWKQWAWMKYYRVWEANRKVFLYPENWIEPELREEKSPFFKDLENELLQNDINRDTAEQAYLNYLEKLDKVANLEIRTIYNETISADESVLHVFGRTRSSLAPEYFYRKRINQGRWTAWEKVELEIAGNHLVAGIHNRRLHLLWPQFLEKAVQPAAISMPSTAPGTVVNAQPTRYWEVRLFWSELKKGKWAPKVLSDTFSEIYQSDLGGNYLDRITYRVKQLPYIEVKELYANDPDKKRWGWTSHNKIGKQISIKMYSLSGILCPTNGYFYYNFIKNYEQPYYFYFGNGDFYDHPNSSPQDMVNSVKLLDKQTSNNYTVIDSHAQSVEGKSSFFLWDAHRSYTIDYLWGDGLLFGQFIQIRAFLFSIHYHPFVETFIKELNIWGIIGLLNRRIQVNPQSIPGSPATFNFGDYHPTPNVAKGYTLPDKTMSWPVEDVDFSYKGAYSLYNWELFFHAPFHIANKLAGNQRFEEALEWFHYIFNPTNTDNAVLDPAIPQQKYWITKPFYETTKAEYYKQKIENLLLAIAKEDSEAIEQVKEWRDKPFNPHLIARMRTVAYQKSVLIKYIQTLIAWGDQLFRRNTIETINEATQLYVLADSVLGPRPKRIPKKVVNPIKTFYQLEQEGIDGFGNALKEVENLLSNGSSSSTMGGEKPELPRLDVLYFCIPNNEKLLSMWDIVGDRLFKIRHCMNIEGTVQQLPLFDPPIDPGALVRAAAGGLDLSSAVAEMNAPMPLYRFNFMIQRALELCSEVKSLGAAMLSALEKKDAEAFALLRSSNEVMMIDAVRDVKNNQIDEAARNWDSLIVGKTVTEERKAYYERLVNDGWNTSEILSFSLTSSAIVAEATGIVLSAISSGMSIMPSLNGGVSGAGGSPVVSFTIGGTNFYLSLTGAADVAKGIAGILQIGAAMSATVASYDRRNAEWDFQKSLAEKELPQIDKQIEAARIRVQIANIELRNHDKQKENLEKELEYMHSKYTNQELYDWMINQISTVYFQSYQLAFDIAKRAERCFRYELGLSNSNYIQFGYWDGLKKGLISGDKLYYDLKRLETAYYEQNRREYELTKHISLSQLDPVALLKLRQNGECILDVPETLFDMDYPGHYFRRIKSVSLSIPCIAGPYTTIACTLTLNKNSVRKDSSLLSGTLYERNLTDDYRFRDELGTIQSIATSSAQNDSGMFELNFRDERYLPFEGAGAIGTWHIKLNKDFSQFDITTISDLIIHMKYTAREGGDILKTEAVKDFNKKMNAIALSENKKGLYRVYDVKREFSAEWHKFLHPASSVEDQQLVLDNLQDRLPYFTKNFKLKKVSKIEIVALATEKTKDYKVMVSPLGNADAALLSMSSGTVYHGLHNAFKELNSGSQVALNTWIIKIKENGVTTFKSLPPDSFQELFLIINYTIT